MIRFTATILKFGEKGEKTGWTYFEIPADLADLLQPGVKKSFRVKGKLDSHPIKAIALIPMGGGAFIMPLNATMRKAIKKKLGSMLNVQLQVDKEEYQLNEEFMECLADEPKAQAFFNSFTASTQRYYSKWIESAKTDATKTKRIALAVTALSKKMDYGEMLRSQRKS
ncbi:MAG: DUF1905 domain-containing protein [Chitinophagaceae bacterium]|nr:DUF1905 domain-containing protein [Chitinophagaceae bacterium]